VSIIPGAAHLSELALQSRRSGVFQSIAKFFDFLFSTSAVAELFAECPSDHEAEGGKDQIGVSGMK